MHQTCFLDFQIIKFPEIKNPKSELCTSIVIQISIFEEYILSISKNLNEQLV